MSRTRVAHLIRSALPRLRKAKPVILAFCVVVSLLILLEGTMAWYTAANFQTNSIESDAKKKFGVEVVDVFSRVPLGGGDICDKRVGAYNHREMDAFVRLLVMPVFVIDPVAPATEPTLLPAAFGTHVFIEDMNNADWIDGGDGYYYYKKILPGLTSTDTGFAAGSDHNLFNSVSLASNLPAEYQNAHLVIEIKCEAVTVEPDDEYINSWWDGQTPPSSPGNPLWLVHSALQTALGQ